MPTRTLNITIAGDPSGFSGAVKRVDRDAGKIESRVDRMGKRMSTGLKLAGVAAAGALVVGLKKSADAAIESEKANARLQSQLKALGISYAAHRDEIAKTIDAHSRLSGFDDEDLGDSFTNIVRTVGDVDKALKLNAVAMDLARAKHLEVAKAGDIVAKVAGGNTGVLGRYGIQIDKNASSSEALAALQRKFAGQAEAYGKTTAGAMDRAGVAGENLGETVGATLTPLLAKGAEAFAELMRQFTTGEGPGGRIRAVMEDIAAAVRSVVHWFKEHKTAAIALAAIIGTVTAAVLAYNVGLAIATTLTKAWTVAQKIGVVASKAFAAAQWLVNAALTANPIGIVIVALAALGTGLVIAYKKSETFRKVVEGVFGAVKNAVLTAIDFILGGISTFLDAMGKMLDVASHIPGIGGKFKGLAEKVHNAADRVNGLRDEIDRLKSKSIDVKVKFRLDPSAGSVFGTGGYGGGAGDGVGRSVGKLAQRSMDSSGFGFLPGAAFGGDLKGARPVMRTFAAIGSRFGLGVTSGRRPGAITSSGNRSWHDTGEAVDMGDGRGPDAQKLGFFRYMKAAFGGRLAELIYTPGGAGIKNGQPFTYTGQVAADHYDHVHVAFDSGAPGIGDGIGQAASAAKAAGFRGADLVTAVAVAGPESGFHNRRRLHTSREDSRGMTQVNVLAHPWARALNLYDAFVNYRAARRVWREAGGSFRPWSAFTSGAFRQFLPQARSAVGGSAGGGAAKPKAPGTGTWAGGGGGGGASHFTGTPLERLEAAGALAELTPGAADDIGVADLTVKYWEGQLAAAKRSGNPNRITAAARGLKTARDTRSGLNADTSGGADTSLAVALRANTEAATALKDEMKRNNDFADSVVAVTGREAVRALVDFMSGQIVGFSYQGRALSAGSGVGARY